MSAFQFSIEPSWDQVLKHEYTQPYFQALMQFLEKERQTKTIFPPEDLVFHAFKKTPFEKVKVVIMGQDPYHGFGQAHGLSFSVPMGVKQPPSLKNIFKELASDLHILPPAHGSLESWAEQGVLLLNALLTVEEGKPLAHQKKGWEPFTDAVIRALAQRQEPVVFLLWGKNAVAKCMHVKELKENPQHFILTAAHPSPLSAHNGFFGCRHFSKTNQILSSSGSTPINWSLA